MMDAQTGNERQAKKIGVRADDYLWQFLETKDGFQREAKVGNFTVDFVSFDNKVIIDVDSWWKAVDGNLFVRDAWLKEQGFTVLKFWSFDILRNCAGVMKIIEGKLKVSVSATVDKG